MSKNTVEVPESEVNRVYVKVFFLVSDKPGSVEGKPKYVKHADKVFEDLFGYTGENLASKLAQVTNGAVGVAEILNDTVGFRTMQLLMEDKLYWNVLRELVSMNARYQNRKRNYKKIRAKQKKKFKKYSQFMSISEDETIDSRERSRCRAKAASLSEDIEDYNRRGKKMRKEGDKIEKEYDRALKRIRKITGIEKVKSMKSSSGKGGVSFSACRELGNMFKQYNGTEYYEDDIYGDDDSNFGALIAQYLGEDGFDYDGFNQARRNTERIAVAREDDRRSSRRKNDIMVVHEDADDDEYDDSDPRLDRLADAIDNQTKMMEMMIQFMAKQNGQTVTSSSQDDDASLDSVIPDLVPYKKPKNVHYNQDEYDAMQRRVQDQYDAILNGTYQYPGDDSDSSDDDDSEDEEPEKVVPPIPESAPVKKPIKKIQPVVHDEPQEEVHTQIPAEKPSEVPGVQNEPKDDTQESKKPELPIPGKDAEELNLGDFPEWMSIDRDFSMAGMPIKPMDIPWMRCDMTPEISELYHKFALEQRRHPNSPKAKQIHDVVREMKVARAKEQNELRMKRYNELYAEWAEAHPDLAKQKEEQDKALGK